MALGFQSHTFFIEQIFVKQINSWRLFCSNGQKLRRIIYVNRKNLGISLDKSIFWGIISLFIGVSPSGKALDSDSNSRWFESIYPSQNRQISIEVCRFTFYLFTLHFSLFSYKVDFGK